MTAEGRTTLTCAALMENTSAMQNVIGFDMNRTATLGWVGIGPLHHNFRWRRTD